MNEFEMITIQQENNEFILSIVVAIVTFVSVVVVYIDYRNRKNKERAEKSIEIAKDFALNIVEPLSIIHTFYKEYNIDKILNKVHFLKLEDFDIEELTNLYSEHDINEYLDIIEKNKIYNDKNIKNIIGNVLNALEYHCMYISSEIADDKYIYNSLHQQFLKSIALLYIEISLINIDDKDKYYTNIIHVYNLWKDKYIESMKKELKILKKQKKLNEKQKKLKKKLLPSPKI